MSVRHALLALLSEGPKYGLQLRQEFEDRTGDVWPLNTGQVYTTMQRLERDGLVESDPGGASDGPQKRYQITASGKDELAVWLRTPPGLDTPPRDELVIKVLVALRLPGVDVREILQAHRRHTVTQMRQYTRLKEDAPDDLPLLLVADAQLFRLESLVRWLDSADGRLKHHGVDTLRAGHGADDAPVPSAQPPGVPR
ncbi:PadR family transcriptional regulator [Streptomyces sp. NPDC102270]|uniref:PadR family transcriptional regulator n=1 Tax=Streptomyces sp. NPDC102270 TaxID=3366150 RepID=UPI00381E1B5E